MKISLATILSIATLFLGAQTISEKEVSTAGLSGTLTTPTSDSKTAILIIAGSGPTDRDGNSAVGLKNNSLKMLAEELTLAGYAVLRYDKRGIGGSSSAVVDRAAVRFEHFIEDAGKWLDFLTQQGYDKLIIAGHSQGSLVAMIAAQGNENVIGFISLAGLSENVSAALVRQLSAQSPELGTHAKEKLDSLKAGHTVKKYSPYLISLLNPEIQPFLQSYMGYTPSEEVAQLSVPCLFINGTTDIQVEVADAERLHAANPKSSLLIIEGMNHILKDSPMDRMANMATYNDPSLPLNEKLIPAITNFIDSL